MQIVITGISQGLGKELFDLLKKNKDLKIIAFSRRFLEEQYEFERQNPNIKLIPVDLSNLTEVETALDEINVDDEVIFINNAATIYPIEKIENIASSNIISAFNLNLLSPILIIKKLIKSKLFVINISTGAAKRAINNWSLYCSSKSGLEMFLSVIQQEGIDIINLDPGVMDTNMQKIIRSSNFVEVDYFKSLKTNNELKSAKDVANNIFEKYIKLRLNK